MMPLLDQFTISIPRSQLHLQFSPSLILPFQSTFIIDPLEPRDFVLIYYHHIAEEMIEFN